MIITVNAAPHEVNATRLSEALAELGFTSPAIATALNGEFVAAAARDETRLNENDRLEVLAPMQGG